MKLEEKIATLRKKNGWSQEELAFRLDVSRQAVSKWEMGASLPELDNILKMSEIFGCSTDYLLKEDEEEKNVEEKPELPVETTKQGRQVCDEEGEGYLSLIRKISWKLALGVAICVLSPVTMFVLLGLSGRYGTITEEFAGGMGVVAVLLVCAVGLIFLITCGLTLSKYEYLDKEIIFISDRLKNSVEEQSERFQKPFIAAITCGVVLCVLSTVPLMIMGAFGLPDYTVMYALATLLCIVACAVFLFVRFGIIHGSYTKLLQEGDYTQEKKKKKEKESLFASVYWCVVTAAYLGWSFYTMDWHITWIVWPIAGITFAVIAKIIEMISGKKID